MKFINFNNRVDTIFIMLGFACNFNCNYCLQHKFKISTLQTSYNKDIITFIKHLSNKNDYINVTFIGGEPLLYINVIRNIIEDLKDTKNISYSITTNGSLINDDTLPLINENNISVRLSWDGGNTKYSRNVDIFETNKDNIFKIKNGFFIGAVFNGYNSPLSLLNDINNLNKDYYKRYSKNILFYIDSLYNLNNSSDKVFLVDYNKYKNDMMDIVYRFKNNDVSYAEEFYIKNLIQKINHYTPKDYMKYSPCNNGISVLNMDLEGNLYLCHNNTEKKLGTIHSNINDYMLNYTKYNNILPKYFINCKSCSIRYCCAGGCMLLSKEELETFYCVQKKSILEPLIDF